MITLTENAQNKIKELMTKEEQQGLALRVAVVGGGCSGYQYGMSFDSHSHEGDTVLKQSGFDVYVDPMSAPMLKGAQIDYVETLQGAGFHISNPNAKSSCGCGHSFSPEEGAAKGGGCHR